MTFNWVTAGVGSECVFGVHPYGPFSTLAILPKTLYSLLSPFSRISQIGDFTACWERQQGTRAFC